MGRDVSLPGGSLTPSLQPPRGSQGNSWCSELFLQANTFSYVMAYSSGGREDNHQLCGRVFECDTQNLRKGSGFQSSAAQERVQVCSDHCQCRQAAPGPERPGLSGNHILFLIQGNNHKPMGAQFQTHISKDGGRQVSNGDSRGPLRSLP